MVLTEKEDKHDNRMCVLVMKVLFKVQVLKLTIFTGDWCDVSSLNFQITVRTNMSSRNIQTRPFGIYPVNFLLHHFSSSVSLFLPYNIVAEWTPFLVFYPWIVCGFPSCKIIRVNIPMVVCFTKSWFVCTRNSQSVHEHGHVLCQRWSRDWNVDSADSR